MAESPLFKRAFVRGLNVELVRRGVAQYPSKEASDYAADFIADNSGMADPYTNPDQITEKVAEQLCTNLVEASQHLCKEAGNQYSPVFTKTAQDTAPVEVAGSDAWALMEKAAAETGSLMEGGDNTNDLPAATGNAEAALEQTQRPENYANLGEQGVGGYERKGEGNVGTEEAHPEKPKATEEGTNSPIENTNKHGSLADIVAKISKKAADTGQLMDPGKETNDLPAATGNAEAALEQKNRPENYANKGEDGVGRSDMVPSKDENVGREKKHPEAPTATDSGKTNAPLEHIQGSKNAAFEVLFKEASKDLVPYLPAEMEDEQKVAHVRTMLGMDTGQRASYLHDLYSALGAQKEASEAVRDHYFKTAAEKEAAPKEEKNTTQKVAMPPAMLEKMEGKEDKKCSECGKEECDAECKAKCESKKEEKEEAKEASSNNSVSALKAAITNLNHA